MRRLSVGGWVGIIRVPTSAPGFVFPVSDGDRVACLRTMRFAGTARKTSPAFGHAAHVLSASSIWGRRKSIPAMARYTGPKVKLSRRVGVPIADIPKHTAKELQLPGMHGYRGRRNTEYGVRLTEKQKLRYLYGMLEKQFRRFITMAKKSKGN